MLLRYTERVGSIRLSLCNTSVYSENLRDIDDKLSIIHRIEINHVNLMKNNEDTIEA